MTKGKCEVVVHGILCTLNFHSNWVILQVDVANAFKGESTLRVNHFSHKI
jgi:hypothetical protein